MGTTGQGAARPSRRSHTHGAGPAGTTPGTTWHLRARHALERLVAGAGFRNVDTGSVTAIYQTPSPEHFTQWAREVAPPIANLLSGQSPEVHEQVWRKVTESWAPLTTPTCESALRTRPSGWRPRSSQGSKPPVPSRADRQIGIGAGALLAPGERSSPRTRTGDLDGIRAPCRGKPHPPHMAAGRATSSSVCRLPPRPHHELWSAQSYTGGRRFSCAAERS